MFSEQKLQQQCFDLWEKTEFKDLTDEDYKELARLVKKSIRICRIKRVFSVFSSFFMKQ